VVRITADFQQERVLHPAAMALLNHSFSQGWADPNKLNNNSRQTAILLQQVRQKFAELLDVRADEIEFSGESDLGFELGIAGLLNTQSQMIYSAIDRQRVFAIAQSHEKNGNKVNCLPVDKNGVIKLSTTTEKDVLVWQVANGETGNIQANPKSQALIFADCGTYSIPLAIASSVALEAYLSDTDIRAKLKKLLIEFISEQISDVDIASTDNGLSKFLSCSFANVESDRLLLELEKLGFAVDSGSACKSADMQPSHVLAAMGRPIVGNIRITLHKDITEQMVVEFCQALKISVEKLRKN